MIVSLVDSGPLVALYDSSDKFHKRVREFLKKFKGNLVSTWAVVTEVLYLLSFSNEAQISFLEWVEVRGIQIKEIELTDLHYIKTGLKKYSDLPMDFADSTLMAIAEKEKINKIFTIDKDFSIYKKKDGKTLERIFTRGKD